jgi:hypothetical protein
LASGENDDMKEIAARYKERLAMDDQNRAALAGAKIHWEALMALIKSKRDSINAEIGEEVLSWEPGYPANFSMTRKNDGARLEGGYDDVNISVFFRCHTLPIAFTLEIKAEFGTVGFYYQNPDTKMYSLRDPSDITYDLMRDFLSS